MEKSGAETHDFMDVESFSQLHFTPRVPPKENSIRLFGKEFSGSDPATTITDESSSANSTATIIHKETKENGKSRRKFECHYCCRNFHTSQALGGHQNAHRRERLEAKRAHIQPLKFHRSSSTAQMYGFVNHHDDLTTTVTPPYHHDLTATVTPPYHHHPTTNCIINYSSNAYHQTPINGGRLPSWRFPTAVPAFNRGGLLDYSDTGSSSPSLYMHESKPSFYDQVSLDLHL